MSEWVTSIAAGGYLGRRIARDTIVRIDDVEGDACVQLLACNANFVGDRFNPGDTMKIPWQAYIGVGSLLLTDLGRILFTVVGDTSARHDLLCSASNQRDNERRYGAGSISSPTPNARDLLALAGAKVGLARVDIGPCVNVFKQVRVEPDGSMHLVGDPQPSSHIELRAEMDLLLCMANTPHRLDDRSTYASSTVRVSARVENRPSPDPFREGSDARIRLFENTESFVAGLA